MKYIIITILVLLYCKNEIDHSERMKLGEAIDKKNKTNEEINLNNLYFINAEGGLYFREKPNQKSKVLALIPEGSIISVKEITTIEEKINNILSYWYKINWIEKEGYIFGGFTIKLNSETRDDYNIFLNEYKKICLSLDGCYSLKIYNRGDAGAFWSESSQFLINTKDKKVTLGITYGKAIGKIIFVKMIKEKFYIFYNPEHLLDKKNVIGSIKGTMDTNDKSIFTYDPNIFDGKDFPHYNKFNHEMIEYKDEYYPINNK